jgi:hypothetical protein
MSQKQLLDSLPYHQTLQGRLAPEVLAYEPVTDQALVVALGGVELAGIVLGIDLSAEEITALLAQASRYCKTGQVYARPAIPGEHVMTRPADGTEETRTIAGPDHGEEA